MPKTLLTELVAKQEKEKLSDKSFGAKLGISQQLWCLYRSGDRNIPCPQIFRGIAKAYPELLPSVLLFLGFNVDTTTLTADTTTKAHQTRCSGLSAPLRSLARVFHLGG